MAVETYYVLGHFSERGRERESSIILMGNFMRLSETILGHFSERGQIFWLEVLIASLRLSCESSSCSLGHFEVLLNRSSWDLQKRNFSNQLLVKKLFASLRPAQNNFSNQLLASPPPLPPFPLSHIVNNILCSPQCSQQNLPGCPGNNIFIHCTKVFWYMLIKDFKCKVLRWRP